MPAGWIRRWPEMCEQVDAAVRAQTRDRVDLWVAKFDPDGVRIPTKTDDNRYVEMRDHRCGDGRDLGQHPRRRCRGAGSAPGRAGGQRVRG